MKPNKLIKSFGYAFQGLKYVFSNESNMKIHLCFSVIVIACGILLNISNTEWMICLLCIGMVIGMEMMNTAIEKLVDKTSPEHHPLAGLVKDIAAGAVLFTVIISVIVGSIIFIPKGLEIISKVIKI